MVSHWSRQLKDALSGVLPARFVVVGFRRPYRLTSGDEDERNFRRDGAFFSARLVLLTVRASIKRITPLAGRPGPHDAVAVAGFGPAIMRAKDGVVPVRSLRCRFREDNVWNLD